jgi:type I restriction enzyme M protein
MIDKLYSPIKSSNADLQQRISKIYDHLYANAPVRTPSGIAIEVGKILHTGIFIENFATNLFSEKLPSFSFDRLTLRKLSKSTDPFVESFANSVRSKYTAMTNAWGIYDTSSQINLSNFDIAFTCSCLNGILISDKDRDVFGDALEIFRGQWAKRASGQFFTDSLVTQLAILLLKFNPILGDDLVDICAGTGGFVLAGLDRIHYLLRNSNSKTFNEADLVNYALSSLKGQEIDPDVFEIANATLSSRLNSQKTPLITLGDSLQPSAFTNHPRIKNNSHLCAATNPPFGTKITIKDEAALRDYELAAGPRGVLFRSPDILFIEQNIKILKPGEGRLAIVTPYQILSGPQSFFVREWIIKNTQILCVVDLPAATFQPHTGTKTSLLILRKREKPLVSIYDAEDYSIFMSAPKWIGHDRRGLPVYKLETDGNPTDEILTDIPDVGLAFQEFDEGRDPSSVHNESFVLNSREILNDPQLRINAQFYKPVSKKDIPSNSNISQVTTEWRYEKLKNLIKKIFYPGRFKRHYVDYYKGAIPFLGGSNISQLLFTTDKWIRHDDPKLDELKVEQGWILITRSGSTGIVATVPEAWAGYAMSEHIIRIVPDTEKINHHYLYVVLRSKYMQDVIAKGVFGSVIDEISPDYLGDLDIPIPTNSVFLASIIEMAQKAEEGRNIAIEGILEAEDELNNYLP